MNSFRENSNGKDAGKQGSKYARPEQLHLDFAREMQRIGSKSGGQNSSF
jgi:hypothetical protein